MKLILIFDQSIKQNQYQKLMLKNNDDQKSHELAVVVVNQNAWDYIVDVLKTKHIVLNIVNV